jgi:twitching motility protein PilT
MTVHFAPSSREEAPVAVDLVKLFQTMVRSGISDIHFKANTSPMVRVNGRLVNSGFNKMTGQHIEELAGVIMNEEQRARFERDRELDMAYTVPDLARFRVNIYKQRGSVALSLRVIPLHIRSFQELNLPLDTLQKLSTNTRGMILFTGITGAGKTTSLSAMIDYINRNYSYNIITIEDPVEYFHQDVKSSIAQREIGHDTESFATAVRHILRQDPDVVVLGEMRDGEAIRAGVTAAETGHLVIGTIHTMDAAQTMGRIIESYDSNEQTGARIRVANVLKGVISQRLLESTDGKSRFPATEVLVVTSLIRKLLMEEKPQELHKALEQGQYYGMHSFDQDILRLFNEKKISKEEALDASSNPDDLLVRMNTLRVGELGETTA